MRKEEKKAKFTRLEDTGLTSHNEIRSVMGDRDHWKHRVVNAQILFRSRATDDDDEQFHKSSE